jgi:hypothetical protein
MTSGSAFMAAKGSRSVYRQRRSTSRSVLSIGVSGIGRPYKTSRAGEDRRAVLGDGDGVLEMGRPAAARSGDAPAVAEPGQVLRAARGPLSAAQIAQLSGIALDTLRKIERDAISSPAFFTVAALARVLNLHPAALARTLMPEGTTQRHQAAS